ncbi:MAG: tetratricopeptide repeat protein, partial [Pyrinomonadaceae bacterium]
LCAAFFTISPMAALAKDEWLQVRSKNFFLVGNASEKEIRRVATKLEQFRETFRLVFGTLNLNATVPTNVVVFKSDSSYKPFKPKRADGKLDNFVAGYFQSGEDVNYITLSTEGTDADTYGTIFHEYVHFIINTNFGKADVPPWFNEGLAEYYQTFEIEEDQKVKLGLPQGNHLALLQQNSLIPLGTFFKIGNRALAENANHSRSIFYAQAWALIHYLVQNGKDESMGKFLTMSLSGKPAEQSFKDAFGIDYAQMEKDLRKYVAQSSYKYHALTFKNKLIFDGEMRAAPLTDADSNAYLGDLLYHVHRVDDAEPFLRTALSLQPSLSMANASMGMVKISQRKFAEAKGFLEKAIAGDPKNHIAFYEYAFLLSREGRDEFGYVHKFDAATAVKMREMLRKAIALNPAYTESYELLAFIDLVNSEELDDAVLNLKKALKYQPGNARYIIRIAEIFLRQNKFQDASAIAEKLATTSDDDEVRTRAAGLANDIRERQKAVTDNDARRGEYEKGRTRSEGAPGETLLVRRQPGENKPTAEQLTKASDEYKLRAINQSLRPLVEGEKQVLGRIAKIDCKGGINYSIKVGSETFVLTSKDFQTLAIVTFTSDTGGTEVGCDSNLSNTLAVISYRPMTGAKALSKGDLVAVEFVPNNFRFIDVSAEAPPPTYEVEESGPPRDGGDLAEQRRKAMMDAIRERLRKPAGGERRELGFIERTECSSKSAFMHIKVGTEVLKLIYPQAIVMGAFTPDVEGVQLGCGMKGVDIPVVFVFKPVVDAKGKVAGELVSLEFVPKSFTLN